MADKPTASSDEAQLIDWNAADQNLLSATLSATPTQRLAWLEEALQVAYASGALKPRRLIEKEEWEKMGSLPRESSGLLPKEKMVAGTDQCLHAGRSAKESVS